MIRILMNDFPSILFQLLFFLNNCADNEFEVENNNTVDNIVIDRIFISTLTNRLDKTYI